MISLVFLFPILLAGERIYELDTIYVTTSRYKIDILHAPFSVGILPKDEIPLNERLMKLPGVSLFNYGNLSTISVRGTSSKETTISLNGIQLNSPQSGDFDISLIPSYFIDEGYIAGISGAGLQPAGNLGNMAAFYTKEKERSIILTNGSFGRIGAGSIYSLYRVIAGFYVEQNRNRYPFKDEFNKIYHRENAQYTHWANYFTLDFPLKINLFSSFRDAAIPEKLGSISGVPHKKEGLIVGSFLYDTKSLRIGGYGNFYSLYFEDTIFGKDQHNNITGSIDVSFKSRNRELGFYIKREYTSSTKIGKHTRAIAGINFLERLKLKDLTSLPSIRMEISKERLYGLSFVLPFFVPTKNYLGTYHNLSFGYRYPTMDELYWPEDIFAAGNPSLRSETEMTIETGIRYISFYFLKLGGFLKIGKNTIIWRPGDDGKWRPLNFARFFAWGGEFEVSFDRPLKISFGYNLFFGKMDSGILPYRPRHNISLSLEKFGFYTEAIFLLTRPVNPSGLLFLEDIYLINLGPRISKRLGSFSLKIDFRIKNIFDKNYQFVEGYPLPGRQYEITLKINGVLSKIIW